MRRLSVGAVRIRISKPLVVTCFVDPCRRCARGAGCRFRRCDDSFRRSEPCGQRRIAHRLRRRRSDFSDESERVYQSGGLEAFQAKERESAREPLRGGPFKGFLAALNLLQREFPDDDCPIRTALVTARSAPAHERVIRTLREWDIRLDESLFLGGLTKSAFLEAFAADVFSTIRPATASSPAKWSPPVTCLTASAMSRPSKALCFKTLRRPS